MKAPQVTEARMVPGFSVQRVCFLVVVVAVLGSFLVEETSASFIFNGCPGFMGSRDLYSKVEVICSDCYNLFRNDELDASCRKDCFANFGFKLCLVALFRSRETTDFNRWISILNSGRK